MAYGRRTSSRYGSYGRKSAAAAWKQVRALKAKAYRAQRGYAAAFPKGSEGSLSLYGPSWKEAGKEQRAMRAALRYKGAGDYSAFMRKWVPKGSLSAAGGYLGKMAGGYLGGPGSSVAGGVLGGNLGQAAANYLGWGDYTQPALGNQLIVGDSQKSISVNQTNDGDILYSHTEYIGNVSVPPGTGASPFQVTSYALNPGLEDTFPFLAQTAMNFELYEFEGLIFQFKPLTGEGGSNILGKVMMATNYDASALPFTNSQAMENYDYASSSKPSVGMHHGVETAKGQRLTNQLYVRTGLSVPGPAPPGQKDRVLTDIGLFQVASEGVARDPVNPTILGELWVSYKIRLSRASLKATQEAVATNFYAVEWPQNAPSIGPSSQSILHENPANTLPCTITNVTDRRFKVSLPTNVTAGAYLVHLYLETGVPGDFFDRIIMANGLIHPWVKTGDLPPLDDVDIAATPLSFEYLHMGVRGAAHGGANLTFMMSILAPNDSVGAFDVVIAAVSSSGAMRLSITQIDTTMLDGAGPV